MLLKKLNPFFGNNFSEVKNRSVLFFYTLVVLLIRLPFFFRDYIDRDESTFILMGQSWVEGHLPYTELWDLKPPLVFFFFGGIIFVFGKSLIAIRLIGTFMIAATSFILFKIGIKMHSKKAGFWMGCFYLYFSSLFGNVQGVMSEHLSMFFFLFGLLFVLKKRSFINLLTAGLLMGCALLMKLNLSYAFLLLLISILYNRSRQDNFVKGASDAIMVGTGALLALLGSWFPYMVKGLSELYIDSVFKAALAYSNTPFQERLSILVPVLIILVALIVFIRWNRSKKLIINEHLLYISSAIIGVVYSFFKIGKLNSHYLLQLYPFLIVLLIIFLMSFTPIKNKKMSYLLIALMFLIPVESYIEYATLGKHLAKGESVYYREGIKIPAYLKGKLQKDDKVLFLDFHIGYWLLDKKPPTKAVTHPSNINRTELYPFFKNDRDTSIEELSYIFEHLKPAVIVVKNDRFPSLDNADPINDYFKEALQKKYQKEISIGKGQIYRIKNYKF